MLSNLIVGAQKQGDGAVVIQRAGYQGDTIFSNLHGKFHETAVRGNLYTFGISDTSIAAANCFAVQTGSSAQPVIGLYNPPGSGLICSILFMSIIETTLINNAVNPGGFIWLYSIGNLAVTAGSSPINIRTLSTTATTTKAFAMSTALSGLTNALALLRPTGHGGLNAVAEATAISKPQTGTLEVVEGSILVPPACVIAVMAQVDASATAMKLSSSIHWEEFPLT